MTLPEATPSNIAIAEFVPDKQNRFFESLKQTQFTGQLTFESVLGQRWFFYLYLGRVIYATGGVHPVRRWRRHLATHCPQIDAHQLKTFLKAAAAEIQATEHAWEYLLINRWASQQLITREQATQLITTLVTEVLFDITQASEVSVLLDLKNPLVANPLILLDTQKLVEEVQQQWQRWQKAKIVDRLPTRAPIIRQPRQLQQHTSSTTFHNLSTILDGNRTLREIAVMTKRDLVDVTRSLLPFIQSGYVDLVDVADLGLPVPKPPKSSTPSSPDDSPKPPLIACVDDSPAICQAMEKILLQGGYRFLAIQDSLRAVPTLLMQKPDLIFLDLMMPNTNGYEICAQLRKTTQFCNTPIVILTGNDGMVDRIRAKLAGSSGYITKPVEGKVLLAVAQKHLNRLIEDAVTVGG